MPQFDINTDNGHEAKGFIDAFIKSDRTIDEVEVVVKTFD